jgi:hypothetical protein
MINKINTERRRSMDPHTTQQQEPVVRSQGGPKTKTDRARTVTSHKHY